MRFVLNIGLMAALALLVGFGLSYFALTDGRFFGAYRVGPWAAWPAAGTATPDPYSAAFLSRSGALQLGRAEGLRFVARTDSDGQPLNRRCAYSIEGHTPVASFWTLQAVTEDGASIARPDGEQTLNSQRIARAPDGAALISVSPRLARGDWLETTGSGPFELVLTLYDTSVFTGAGATVNAMPSILRIDCP